MARTAATVLAMETRLGGRGVAVFLVPICSSPFFVAFVSCPFVTVCMDVVWGAISAVGLLINESQVVASSLWMGGARASTGRRIKDPPLFPETWCVCVCPSYEIIQRSLKGI